MTYILKLNRKTANTLTFHNDPQGITVVLSGSKEELAKFEEGMEYTFTIGLAQPADLSLQGDT